jgi:cytoskeletal protein CcmA (bactofilin family)
MPTSAATIEPRPPATTHPGPAAPPARGRAANIGGSLFIKGEVSGSEDLTVEGRVEGKIDLKDHNLSIAPSGRVSAEIHAKTVTIYGEVNGDVHADDKVEIAETGKLVGDLYSPRVSISDGAQFRGSVDMGRTAVSNTPVISTTIKDRVPAAMVSPSKVATPV